MKYFTYQIAGTFSSGYELLNEIPASVKFEAISKIGIQLKQGQSILLNNQNFTIGKTGRLELTDVYITSVKLDAQNFVIIDMLCIDKE